MEVDEIQRQVCKFQRISNNGSKIAHKGELELEQPYPDDEEDVRMVKKSSGGSTTMDMMVGGGARLCGWPSSRIVRVSRASGGKDRHSKVLTSKGLRDRRVRLSVTTAIQFYDLQDRLGYDQPSKAVEWLLKAASSSIAELPSLNTCFENTPNQLSDEKRRSESEEFDGGDLNYHHQQQQNQNNVSSLSKSACSSTSETSKGSGLSLSRSEIRIKARERARERAKEKDNNESTRAAVNVMNQNQHVNPISQNSSSFTDLLNGHGGISISSPSPNHNNNTTPMDYGFFTPSSSRPQTTSGFSSQIHMGNSSSMPPQYQQNHNHSHFSFLQENFVPVATSIGVGGESYNLNFSISPGLVGFNRGTLQSNIPSLLPHLQRFPPTDGTSSNLPFFVGTVPPNDNHLFPTGYDARLQLCYGDSDQKGKGKN